MRDINEMIDREVVWASEHEARTRTAGASLADGRGMPLGLTDEEARIAGSIARDMVEDAARRIEEERDRENERRRELALEIERRNAVERATLAVARARREARAEEGW